YVSSMFYIGGNKLFFKIFNSHSWWNHLHLVPYIHFIFNFFQFLLSSFSFFLLGFFVTFFFFFLGFFFLFFFFTFFLWFRQFQFALNIIDDCRINIDVDAIIMFLDLFCQDALFGSRVSKNQK